MEMSDRDKEWSGPIDYPHHSDQLDDSKSGGKVRRTGYALHNMGTKDNLIEEAVNEVWEVIKDDSQASAKIGSPSIYTIEKLRQTLSDLYAKAKAAGREEGANLLSLKEWKKAKQEGRAEFAKELLEKADILLAKYSNDRRVPPAEIRMLLESELKGSS